MSSAAIRAKSGKRLQKEIENSKNNTNPYIWYAPMSFNDHEWHFTIRGPKESVFDGGVYHGKIMLPDNFPFSAPDFYFLTPNGRYEINTKICLNISGFHNESWMPSITIEAMVKMIQVFMKNFDKNEAPGVGYMPNVSEAERRRLAKESVNYVCPHCGRIIDLMLPLPDNQ